MKKLFDNMKLLDLTFTLYGNDLKAKNIKSLEPLSQCFKSFDLKIISGNMNGYNITYQPCEGIYINCDHPLDKDNKGYAQIVIFKNALNKNLVDHEKLLSLLLNHPDTLIRRMNVRMY